MFLPFFYHEEFSDQSTFALSEDTSKHIIQVLRMKQGEQLQLTDGKGKIVTGEITSANKKLTEVRVLTTDRCERSTANISIGISLIKNTGRFEWFLEKATEIGVSEIIPMICDRTEKQTFRFDRMQNIIISAMLQSRQAWLPALHEPITFKEVMKNSAQQNKYIAHCMKESKQQLNNKPIQHSTIILIGPEGDFTKDEIDLALQNSFVPVSLGETRLRTETAGIVAAVLLNLPS